MQRPITLGTVAEGAAEELWGAELGRVLENLADENTDWKTKRTIVLTFTFAANEERQVGDLTISAKTRLAGLRGRSTIVFLGRDHGRLVAVEASHQEDMFPRPQGRPEVAVYAHRAGVGGNLEHPGPRLGCGLCAEDPYQQALVRQGFIAEDGTPIDSAPQAAAEE